MFKQNIKDGKKMIGIWQTIPSIKVCHVLINSGVDFIIFDMEHSVFTFKDVMEHSMLCKSNKVGSVVRISKYDPDLISLSFDIGVDVIQIPNIVSYNQIKNIGDFLSYEKSKGYSPFTVREKYDGSKTDNNNPLIAIHIENKNILKNIDELLKLKDIDIYFFGLFDLSRSFGFTGNVNNKNMIDEVINSMKKVVDLNKTVGYIVNNIEDISKFENYGNYITYGSDVFHLKNSICINLNKLK